MRKFIFFIFLIFSTIIFSKSKEDLEIERLQTQIKALQSRIEILKKNKSKQIKENKKLKIGLALSGGGAKGFAHIGVLKILEKNNIKVDYITGTSMGALIGSLYSVGYSPDEIEKLILSYNWQSTLRNTGESKNIPLFQKNIAKNYSISLKYDDKLNFSLPKSLKNTQNLYLDLKKLFWKVENIHDFKKLPIPLGVIATDLNTGKAVRFTSGDLAQVVTASISIPTIFDPVKIKNNYYVDGLLSRNFPVEDAFAMGADIVIGVDVGTDLKKKDKYDILSVADQIFAIQSASSTEKQREKATILISPNVKNFKSTDFNSYSEIEKLGEKAALAKLNSLKKYEKTEKNNLEIKTNFNFLKFNKIVINNSKHKEIINSLIKPSINKNLTPSELEKQIQKIYALSFVNKVYYNIEDNSLILNIEENPTNIIGIGFDYETDYGSIFSIGTDINSFGKIGSSSTFEVRVGDYPGIEFKNFFYYGLSNKFGVATKLGYNVTPFYLYKGSHKIASYKSNTTRLESAFMSQFSDLILFSYGASLNYSALKSDIENPLISSLEYSKTYGDIFWNFQWDTTNSDFFPTKGFNGEIMQKWGANVGPDNLNFISTTYRVYNFYPITDTLIFSTKLFGGNVSGEDILPEKFIKLGGLNDNFSDNNFAFNGYRFQQKYLSSLMGISLGVQKEILNNLYFNINIDSATFKYADSFLADDPKNEMWKNYHFGYGIGLNYLSILGPLKVNVSQNSKDKDLIFQFSFGYQFK